MLRHLTDFLAQVLHFEVETADQKVSFIDSFME
jgi:hypothetical protein